MLIMFDIVNIIKNTDSGLRVVVISSRVTLLTFVTHYLPIEVT